MAGPAFGRVRANLFAAVLVASSVTVTACGGGGGGDGGGGGSGLTTPSVQVGSVAVMSPSTQLQVGAQLTATAEVRSPAGALLTGRVVSWTSSNTGVAAVSDAGVVTAVAAGTVNITATSEGRAGTLALTVVPVPVSAVELSAPAATVAIDRTLSMTVSLRGEGGATLSGRAVTWSSSAPQVAAVSEAGVVTGLSAGTATITATSEGKSGTFAVTVVPPPVNSVTLSLAQSSIQPGVITTVSVSLRDDRNVVLTGREVTYASSDPAVATVSGGGMITGVSAGTTTITATSEGKSGSAVLTVIQAPVATVSVTSPQTLLTVGSSTQAAATLRAGDGMILTGRTVSWSTSNTGVATVANGLVTAVAPGTATITATSEGRSGSLSFTVQAPTPASVVVNPGTVGVTVRRTVALTATVRDASGNTMASAPVSWVSSNSTVASVSTAGVVTGLSAGTATITAVSSGVVGTAFVTVQDVAAASITLDVSAVTITVGDVRLIRATVRDALQNVLRGRDVAWTTSNSAVVDGQALGDSAIVTGLAPGSAVVTATVEGRSASAVVTVLSSGQSVCSAIAGASVFGDDGQYLGRFTNRFDSQSVLNEYGTYGSRYSSTSTNNEYGTYGSPYSSLSARNPYASRPPLIVKNGQVLAYYSVNSIKTPRVSPALAMSCDFP